MPGGTSHQTDSSKWNHSCPVVVAFWSGSQGHWTYFWQPRFMTVSSCELQSFSSPRQCHLHSLGMFGSIKHTFVLNCLFLAKVCLKGINPQSQYDSLRAIRLVATIFALKSYPFWPLRISFKLQSAWWCSASSAHQSSSLRSQYVYILFSATKIAISSLLQLSEYRSAQSTITNFNSHLFITRFHSVSDWHLRVCPFQASACPIGTVRFAGTTPHEFARVNSIHFKSLRVMIMLAWVSAPNHGCL